MSGTDWITPKSFLSKYRINESRGIQFIMTVKLFWGNLKKEMWHLITFRTFQHNWTFALQMRRSGQAYSLSNWNPPTPCSTTKGKPSIRLEMQFSKSSSKQLLQKGKKTSKNEFEHDLIPQDVTIAIVIRNNCRYIFSALLNTCKLRGNALFFPFSRLCKTNPKDKQYQ